VPPPTQQSLQFSLDLFPFLESVEVHQDAE
jgi:hypothetical protein